MYARLHSRIHLDIDNSEVRDRKRHPSNMLPQTLTCATECNNTSQFTERGRANCNTRHPSITTNTINTDNKNNCYIRPRNTRGTVV